MSQSRIRCPVLYVEGAVNVRDLGGYTGLGGRQVKKGRFIRAGALSGLTRSGRETVRGLGVDCIVDLRSQMEVRAMPDVIAGDDVIAYHHIPMLDYIQSSISENNYDMFPDSLTDMYIQLLKARGESFRRVLSLMARGDYSVCLFHCTAGKDRTGLTAMLLLGLAGVSREDIVEDYSWSAELARSLDRRGEELPENFPRYLFESPPEVMDAAIEFLIEEYGDITGYLRRIGLNEEEIGSLLVKLLD